MKLQLSFTILYIFAFITPVVISRFKNSKMPAVIGEIIVGIILGKSFFNVISLNDSIINFIAYIGITLLMFISGLEINLKDINMKDKIFKKALFSVLMTFLLYFVIANIFYKIGLVNNILFTAILSSASAPVFIIPYLKSKQLLQTNVGQFIVKYAVFLEISVALLSTIYFSYNKYGFTLKMFSFLIFYAISFLIYYIARKIIKSSNTTGNEEYILTRAAFALIIILGTISEHFGVESIFSAFIAGLMFSTLPIEKKHVIEKNLSIVGNGFFIPVYFMVIGANINIKTIKSPIYLLILPLIALIIYGVRFLVFKLILNKSRFNVVISCSFLCSCQLSFFIAMTDVGTNMGIINPDLKIILILFAILSCYISSIVFDSLYNPNKGHLENACDLI